MGGGSSPIFLPSEIRAAMSLYGAHFTVTLTMEGKMCGCPGEQQPDLRGEEREQPSLRVEAGWVRGAAWSEGEGEGSSLI